MPVQLQMSRPTIWIVLAATLGLGCESSVPPPVLAPPAPLTFDLEDKDVAQLAEAVRRIEPAKVDCGSGAGSRVTLYFFHPVRWEEIAAPARASSSSPRSSSQPTTHRSSTASATSCTASRGGLA